MNPNFAVQLAASERKEHKERAHTFNKIFLPRITRMARMQDLPSPIRVIRVIRGSIRLRLAALCSFAAFQLGFLA